MDINELESFRLSDAVKFNDKLNPRLWSHEQLKPQVRERLLAIADDFREFLGIKDLDVKDITVSGSNAAYTYTPHSDIHLHLVVDLDQVCNNEVYRELFDAKKYQYNDQHNFKIGGYDVELYVQDSEQPHHSQGIYSLVTNDWIKVPSRKKPTIDDISVKSKYQDVGQRVDAAIASGDQAQLDAMGQKIRTMRQAGLDSTGEFGPENLAFKVLRGNGTLDRLRQARMSAKDAAMSLAEREAGKIAKPKKIYGYKNYWFPGYDYYANLSANVDQPSEVDESAQVAVRGKTHPLEQVVEKFVKFCANHLHLKTIPTINLMTDPEFGTEQRTMGHYMDNSRTIEVEVAGRHILDIMRTIAHELVHYGQHERGDMPKEAGDTGSPWENEAHATAGVLMRYFDRDHPEFFKAKVIDDRMTTNEVLNTKPAKTNQARWTNDDDMVNLSFVASNGVPYQLSFLEFYMAPDEVSPVDFLPSGTPDAVEERGRFVEFIQEAKPGAGYGKQGIEGTGAAAEVFGIVYNGIMQYVKKYKPTYLMFQAAEPSRQRLYATLVRKMLQTMPGWRSQQHGGVFFVYDTKYIKQAVAESTGYIPVNSKEARDPRYSMAITQDIRPGEVQRQAAKMGFKTDAAGVPPLLMKLQNQLEEIKTGALK